MFEEIESRLDLHQIINFLLHGAESSPHMALHSILMEKDKQIMNLLEKSLSAAEINKISDPLFAQITRCEDLFFELGVKAGLQLSSAINGH